MHQERLFKRSKMTQEVSYPHNVKGTPRFILKQWLMGVVVQVFGCHWMGEGFYVVMRLLLFHIILLLVSYLELRNWSQKKKDTHSYLFSI